MPQTLRLPLRQPAPAESPVRPARQRPGDSIGEQLGAHFGEAYSIDWLAERLECSPAAAAEVAGYWLPLDPPHLRQQAMMVFAKALRLDIDNLHRLLEEVAPIRPLRWSGPALVRHR
jgi:hypothetical protein